MTSILYIVCLHWSTLYVARLGLWTSQVSVPSSVFVGALFLHISGCYSVKHTCKTTTSSTGFQEDVTLVNLHHQMNRPITESPLLMACYAAHLSQFQVANWDEVSAPLPHLVARGADGGPPSSTAFLHASSCWKPRFTPWGSKGFSEVHMVARARRAASMSAGSATRTASVAADTPPLWGHQTPSTSNAIVIRLQGDVHLLVSPPLLEAVRGFAEAITPTLSMLHPATVLGRLLGHCWTAVRGNSRLLGERTPGQKCPSDCYQETRTEQVA